MNFRLPKSLAAWPGDNFSATFCNEVAHLPHGVLPLQQALAMGSHVVERTPKVMLLASSEEPQQLNVKAGVFFNTVLAGCNCADDPTPMDENNEYVELSFHIDRSTGETQAKIE